MPRSLTSHRWTFALLICALAAACGSRPEDDRPPDVYRVRGVVRQLPAADRAPRELAVRHEAIPQFKSSDGEVVGMESMTMSFPLADPGLADGLAVGDKIEMEFEVRWEGGNPLSITAVEKLPPETPLAFETGG